MKITKYIHSCLLVEDADKTALIDPGQFSWDAGFFTPPRFKTLDTIIITHEHFDHCHMPLLEEMVKQFPQVEIITNPAVAAQLRATGFSQAQTEGAEEVEVFEANHEPLEPLGKAPANIGVHYGGRLTHPGDSHSFAESKEILALPVTAPWGSMIRAAGLALELRPKYIVPIHDWHWNTTARQQAYDRLESFFAEHDITFLKVVDGQPIEA
jgi:L-ascorbate metabolism protein UlaG (beta-lactamase superfamily)